MRDDAVRKSAREAERAGRAARRHKVSFQLQLPPARRRSRVMSASAAAAAAAAAALLHPPPPSRQLRSPGKQAPGAAAASRSAPAVETTRRPREGKRRKKTHTDANKPVRSSFSFVLVLLLLRLCSCFPAARPVSQYAINTGGASNIHFKRVKNKCGLPESAALIGGVLLPAYCGRGPGGCAFWTRVLLQRERSTSPTRKHGRSTGVLVPYQSSRTGAPAGVKI